MPNASDKLHPVYAVVSKDRFLRGEVVDSIVARWQAEADVIPTRFDGATAELADVLDEVRTESLLGDRRLVIVDDADRFISAHREALERYCAAPASSGCLVLLCNSLPRNVKLHRAISQNGEVIQIAEIKRSALAGWLARRTKEDHGKVLARDAATSLIEHVGNAPGVLVVELAKLAAYVADRKAITPADVDALVGHSREEKVFAVVDAMASGDTASALRQWDQVLATDRAAPGRAIAGLAWSVRRLLDVRRAWEAGEPIAHLARQAYTDPRTLERRLARLTTERLEQQLQSLLEADQAVKTGASTLGSAVERFIVTHSQPAA